MLSNDFGMLQSDPVLINMRFDFVLRLSSIICMNFIVYLLTVKKGLLLSWKHLSN